MQTVDAEVDTLRRKLAEAERARDHLYQIGQRHLDAKFAAESDLNRMREALEAAKRMIDVALPQFNWGLSVLSAEAIRLLNDTPRIVNAALSSAGAPDVR